MKKLFSTFCFVGSILCSIAQKYPLTYSDLENWPEIIAYDISNNGKWVFYTFQDRKRIHQAKTYICSVDDSLMIAVDDGKDIHFTQDSRNIVYRMAGDSLCIREMETHKLTIVKNVKSYKMPENGDGHWLAYQLKSNELVLCNLFSGRIETLYKEVKNYTFSPIGKLLLTVHDSSNNELSVERLQCTNVSDGRLEFIWKGFKPRSFAFDDSENKIAFIANESNLIGGQNSLWYYELGHDTANVLIDNGKIGKDSSYILKDDLPRFSHSGDKVFFSLGNNILNEERTKFGANVDVWSYKDEYLQSEQSSNLEYDKYRSYKAVINIYDRKIIQLVKEGDGLYGEPRINWASNSTYLLTESQVNYSEGHSLTEERPNLYLINTTSGYRKCIQGKVLCEFKPKISPEGKYVYWYDLEKRSYFVYNINTGISVKLSLEAKTPFYDELSDVAMYPYSYGVAGWTEGDTKILIYDRYDIWEFDPMQKSKPLNITNGYGRKNKIILRSVSPYTPSPTNESVFKNDSSVILCGFDERRKDNGFFEIKLNVIKNPRFLRMSADQYYFPKHSEAILDILIKAKNVNTFILKKSNATNYPNLVLTKDFVEFKCISNLAPQKQVNWLTSELVHWKTENDKPALGILYKPQNFNSRERYPIIFYFYERLTDGLNKFLQPELSDGPMNIPWFVSHGYLVFCPDIYYVIGKPGESAYSYVVSAAKMMAKKPWVDPEAMGIQGHSWGAFEVDYLVTHSRLFRAASSASGPSDYVSDYGSLAFPDMHGYVERGQPRMGVTLWQDPRVYIKNSPVFTADKVVTPLLMMNNKLDNAVPWSQGVEFFTALRHLKKRAWMLQYDNGGHVLVDDDDQLDYSIRLQQFFDYYLKKLPPPRWMTVGIPAKLKGLDNGLELSNEEFVP